MNTIFRIVWSHARNAWVVTCELARSAGKSCTTVNKLPTLAAIGLIGLSTLTQAAPPATNALPTGGQIVAGQGVITQSSNALTVTQNTQQLIANWQSFDIGKNASVTFNQPNASSVALNRITGQNPSQIFGSLTANGQVMLVNPAGIVFGQGSQVNVGALVASTLNISDQSFLAGNYRFSGSGGEILNQGKLSANGGVVALIAPVVKNEGSIHTPQGGTVLAAGNDVSLDFGGDGLVAVTVHKSTLDTLAQNQGLIQAEGGAVILTAGAARDLMSGAVNNTGIIEAKALAASNGRILLEGGTTTASGTLDASGKQAGEHGGTVTLLGNKVGLLDGAQVDVSGDSGGGTALIGGNWQGKGVEANAQRTYVAETARIDASATGNGDGGKVVVWADEVTRYYGSITAQGGAAGGNGGQVEVSGKKHLDFNGRVDTTAAQGQGGVLLLDPKNIVVATADPGGGAVSRSAATDLDAFTDNMAETSWITPVALVTLLNTADVTLQASNDITVSNDVDASGNANSHALALTAGRSILMDSTSIKTKNGNLTLIANETAAAGVVNAQRDAGDAIISWHQTGPEDINLNAGTGAVSMTIKGVNDKTYSSSGKIDLSPASPMAITAAALALTNNGLNATNSFISIQRLNISGSVTLTTAAGNISVLDSTILTNTIGAGLTVVSGKDATVLAKDIIASGDWNISGNLIISADSFTQEALDATLTAGATRTLRISADSMALKGGANSISAGSLGFNPRTATRPMIVGADGDADALSLNLTELGTMNALGASRNISFGADTNGGLTICGAIPLHNNQFTFYNNAAGGGSITLDATADISTNHKAVSFYPGAGSFTQTAGAKLATGSGGIVVKADSIILQGAASSISGTGSVVSLYPSTAARAIDVGTKDAAKFSLNAAEIQTLQEGFSSIQIGSSTESTGGLTLSAPLTFNDSLILNQAAGGTFTVNATPTVSGALQFVGARPVALNASVSASSGASFAGAVTVGADGLSVDAGTGTATFFSTLTHDANNFTVTADNVALTGNWIGTGTRTLQPTTPNQTIGLGTGTGSFALSTTELSRLNNSTPASVTIGRADGTGAITGGAFTFARPLVLRGGAITQTGAWTPTSTVSLQSGNNDINLTHTSNNFTGAVTVVSGRNITLVDANALTLGALTSTSGGLFNIATKTGDLTLTGAITTNSNSFSAIKLNAGSDAAAGTAAGGNILVSGGTLSTGAGGSATLYSGSVASSTGLTDLLVSGSGRFRYNSDETASNYTTALVAGSNAIYREQPTLTVTPGNLTITYGDATPLATTLGTAYVNGDTSPGTTSGTAIWTIGGTSSTSGKPVVGIHDAVYSNGLVSSLGYGYADNGASSNELTVSQKNITANGITAANKAYDATTTASLNTAAAALVAGGVIGGDAVTLDASGAIGAFADKNVGIGKGVSVSSLALVGSDAGNYTVSDASGATADIISAQSTQPPLPQSPPLLPPSAPVISAPTPINPPPLIDVDSTTPAVTEPTVNSGTTTGHPVFRQQGNVLTAAGRVLISERGAHWVATSSETQGQQPPLLQSENIRLITVPLTLPNNIQSELTIGFRGDGVLVVKAPAEVRQAYEERQILLLAMVSANKRMNVEGNNVTAIILLKDDVGR